MSERHLKECVWGGRLVKGRAVQLEGIAQVSGEGRKGRQREGGTCLVQLQGCEGLC